MVGQQRIREVLEQTNKEFAEESKDETFDLMQDKYQSWKQKLGNISGDSSNNRNRISKDENGRDISGISKRAEPSEFDSNDDVATVSEYIMQYNKDDSIVKTESSNRVVKEDFKDDEQVQNDLNRLAVSERVKSTTKTITIQNCLNNRRSVKILYSKKHPLRQSLLGSTTGMAAGAYDQINELDDSLLVDLENPLDP